MFSYSRRKPKSLGEGDNPADVHIAPNPIASDESTFQLYRSFGYLQSRMLLDLHAGLRDLENELHTLENSDESEDYVASVRSRGVLSPKTKLYPTDRKSLLHAMEQKLASYESCLLNASRLDELLGNRGRKAKLSSIRCRAAVQEYSASDRDLCNDAEDPIRGGLHLSTPRVQPELVLHPLRRNELMWGGKTRARTLSAMVFMGSLPLAHAAETGGGADSQTFLRHATIPDLVLWGFVLPSVVALWYSGSISTDPSFVGMLMMACLWGAEAGTSSLRDLRPTTLQIWTVLAANYVIRDCARAEYKQQHVLKYVVLTILFILLGVALVPSTEGVLLIVMPLAISLTAVVLSFAPKTFDTERSPSDEEHGGMRPSRITPSSSC